MKPWNASGIDGQARFLKKVWRHLVGEEDEPRQLSNDKPPPSLIKLAHQTIRKVTEDIENLRFNTAIAQLMIFSNEMIKHPECYTETAEIMIILLSPFAPHFAEEVWQILGYSESIAYQPWPEYDEELAREDNITAVFQTNGKVRAQAEVPKGLAREALEEKARENDNIKRHLEGHTVVKVVVVPDRLVNFVIKPT